MPRVFINALALILLRQLFLWLNLQLPGVDFTETIILVVKPTTIWMVLCLALARGWNINRLNVNNAFLQGILSEEVYMTQPPGFVDLNCSSHVCRLRKAIYSLKHAPQAWYKDLCSFLLAYKFVNS